MNRIIAFLTLCFLMSCQEKTSDKTVITGQIINPNQDFLVLTDRENFLDTIFLNSQGEFRYEMQLLEEKVFHFKHSPEIQLIYLKPNDSITLHLNTVDFDGSLAFGGDSAKENNLMIDLFLNFRADQDLLFRYHNYTVDDFLMASDSLKSQYLNKINSNQNHLKERSSFFQDYVENSIAYHTANLNESFFFLTNRDYALDSKNDFIDSKSFRNGVEVNKDSYWDLAYLKFLDNFTKNLAVEDCIQRGVAVPTCQRMNTVEHLISRRNVVSDLIENPYLKNHLIKRFLTLEITYADTQEKINNTLKAIEDYNLLASDVKFLNRLADFHEQFVIGNTVSNVDFIDVNGDEQTLEPLLQKPTIVHTWSAFSDSNTNRRLPKINRLRENYPEIKIIGLNIDYNQHRFWRSKVLEHEFDTNLELQVKPNPEFEDLYIYYINKLFFVCPHGKVRDRKLLIFDDQIESSILELINNNHTYM